MNKKVGDSGKKKEKKNKKWLVKQKVIFPNSKTAKNW